MSVKIYRVDPKSLCGEKGVCAGETLLSINGSEVSDVLDYRFLINATALTLTIESADGEQREIKIKKGEYDETGLEFETYLMDKQRRCANNCVFCFIDQLPHGMRESLYFKDDDSRLSFLFGNYITLTNLTRHEIDRIKALHISPVNVSVHTMNPELRVQMMRNKNAGKCLEYLNEFAQAGISLNTQLVLCPGINDGAQLEYSLEKLAQLTPALCSIAVVPVGLTSHREGLFALEAYTKQGAAAVIDTIDSFNRRFTQKGEPRIAFAADEFYLKAEREMPSAEQYEDFPQLENGVGQWALLKEEFSDALAACTSQLTVTQPRAVTVATGTAAYPLICSLAQSAQKTINNLKINVVAIENDFFGKQITVAGLLTGEDFLRQLSGKVSGSELLIPAVSLTRGGDLFLDGVTLQELSDKLRVPVRAVTNSGDELLAAFIGE